MVKKGERLRCPMREQGLKRRVPQEKKRGKERVLGGNARGYRKVGRIGPRGRFIEEWGNASALVLRAGLRARKRAAGPPQENAMLIEKGREYIKSERNRAPWLREKVERTWSDRQRIGFDREIMT